MSTAKQVPESFDWAGVVDYAARYTHEAQTSCSRPMIQVLTRVYVGEESSRKELNIISD